MSTGGLEQAAWSPCITSWLPDGYSRIFLDFFDHPVGPVLGKSNYVIIRFCDLLDFFLQIPHALSITSEALLDSVTYQILGLLSPCPEVES